MKQITVVVVSLATVAVAFASYWIGQDQGSLRPKLRAEASEQSNSGSHEGASLGRLEMRLAALERSRSSSNAHEDEEAPIYEDVQNRKGEQPFDPELMMQRDMRRDQAIAEALQRETVDRAWASTAESEIKSAVDSVIKDDSVQYSVETLSCLTSICEMVLSASTADHLANSGLHLMRRITGMGSIDIKPAVVAPDGTATATLRFYREGYERPDAGIM